MVSSPVPNTAVLVQLIDKLSVRTPTGEVKLKVMKEIAQEHKIDWDITESEKELLKPPEEPIVCHLYQMYIYLPLNPL